MDGYETRNDLEKGALGFVELTRRLIVPGADQRWQQERAGLQAFGTKICAPPWLCDSGQVSSPFPRLHLLIGVLTPFYNTRHFFGGGGWLKKKSLFSHSSGGQNSGI